MSAAERTPLDVWLRFAEGDEEQEQSEYEANTYLDDDRRFRVEWYHTGVGQVSAKTFDTYEEATAWLEAEQFIDFSS